MLRPSYSELMDILNQDADADKQITSRYSIVIATAKRARQIIDGAECDTTGVHTDKAVSIAINEIKRGCIKITPEGGSELAYAIDGVDEIGRTNADKPKNRPIRPASGVIIDEEVIVKTAGNQAEYDDDLDLDMDYDDDSIPADEARMEQAVKTNDPETVESFAKKKGGRLRDGYVPENFEVGYDGVEDRESGETANDTDSFNGYESGEFDDYDYGDGNDGYGG